MRLCATYFPAELDRFVSDKERSLSHSVHAFVELDTFARVGAALRFISRMRQQFGSGIPWFRCGSVDLAPFRSSFCPSPFLTMPKAAAAKAAKKAAAVKAEKKTKKAAKPARAMKKAKAISFLSLGFIPFII